MKKFIINGIILAFTSLLMQTIGMWFRVYISNKIGAESIGSFSLIMSVYLFAITIANSGINLAATRIVAEQLATNNKFATKKAIRQCLCFSLIVGSIAAILLSVLAPFICRYWLHGTVSNSLFYILSR